MFRTEVPFVLDQDHLDLRRVFVDGNLAEFSVNYRLRIGQHWHVAVRYDNCHGPPHVHRFFDKAVFPLPAPETGLSGLLAAAEEDLLHHWREDRRKMVGIFRQLEEGVNP